MLDAISTSALPPTRTNPHFDFDIYKDKEPLLTEISPEINESEEDDLTNEDYKKGTKITFIIQIATILHSLEFIYCSL